MAKRAPLDEKPFRPLDVSILSAVVQHAPEARGAEVEPLRQIIELPESTTSLRLALPVAATPVASTVPTMPRLDQEKRILFTREESQALDRLINNLAVQVRAQVKASHVLRALTTLLLHAEPQIDQRAGERGTLVRPSNGDFTALQQFEREIAHILAHAFRDAGPLR